jgi:hypothetical protein
MRLKLGAPLRFSLPLIGVTAVVSVLAMGHKAPTPPADHEDVVWVYYTSLCAKPGDAGDCRIVSTPQRESFPTHEACAVYRDADLGREHNARLMGSCLKQHEA